MSIPSDNPLVLARGLSPGEGDPELALAVGDGEIVALSQDATTEAASYGLTLLRCLAGLDAPVRGELWINGVAVHALRPAARLRLSHARCGVVPRQCRLLPELTVVENTALPLLLAGVARAEARQRATAWLERLEVADYAKQRFSGGSGSGLPAAAVRGVAIARALVADPMVVLADEPLLGLAAEERFRLLRVLRAAAGSHGLTLLIATSDTEVIRWADRQIPIGSGSRPHAGSLT